MSNVGAITKAVRNSASETSTTFGGVCCRPSALRRNDSTTTMRVNDVTITKIDGASDSTVNRAMSWTMLPVDDAPLPRSSVKDCAKAGEAMTVNRVASASFFMGSAPLA